MTRIMLKDTTDAGLRGHLEFAEGVVHSLQGEFRAANEKLELADKILREECNGAGAERAHILQNRAGILHYLGDLKELQPIIETHLREADERGDLYGSTNIRTQISSLWYLCLDRPQDARNEIEIAMNRWTGQGFSFQHWQALYHRSLIDLYEGKGQNGYERFVATQPKLRSSFVLMGLQLIRIMALDVQGRLALAAAVEAGQPASKLVQVALKAAQQIERENMRWAKPLAQCIRAGVARLRGQKAEEQELLRAGCESANAVDLSLYAAAMQRCLGHSLGGDGDGDKEQGQRLIAQADELMRGRGITNPARWTKMICPGDTPNPSRR
jgi:hypothetical protein